MHFPTLTSLLLVGLSSAASLGHEDVEARAVAKPKTPSFLRATAIVTNAHNHSTLQCWEFATPFIVSNVPGTIGAATLSLADLSNVTYAVVPGKFDGGRHNAPYKQIVVFLSGLAVISLPHAPQTATIPGGADGLIVATDEMGGGHVTKYPSDQPTLALELPFAHGKVPAHSVTRKNRPCEAHEQIIY